MSEKITFRELIESIAKETDHSKQFTHDFFKDFVDVINDGLESDGKVNIAGLGKFDLKWVDERKGYNPQAEEKITIPAHNKLVFKPYKEVRELVNTPYKHLDSELIDEENPTEEGSTDPEESGQTDFIPTGLPRSPKGLETEGNTDSEVKAPFNLDDHDERDEKQKSEYDEDIVEFKNDDVADEDNGLNEEREQLESSSQPEDDKTDQPEQDAGGSVENKDQSGVDNESSSASSEEESVVENTLHQTEELIEESGNLLDTIEESKKKNEEEPMASPSFEQSKSRRKQTSTIPTIAVAAAFIILLVAGGAWYFSLLSNGNQQELISQQITSTSAEHTETNNQQSNSKGTQHNQDPQQTTAQNLNQSQNTNTSTTSSVKDSEDTKIQKGQTLWSLAEEKYGNPRLWPWIYDKNESVENPDLIIAGNSLSLPLPSGPQNSLTTSDSIGVAKGYLSTYRWYKTKESPKAKNHLWGAKHFHENVLNIADIKIDEADLTYAKKAR